jgi:hypothetical protein
LFCKGFRGGDTQEKNRETKDEESSRFFTRPSDEKGRKKARQDSG